MLILVRHGESTWNKENKFTGWTDVELTENGINQAKQAGKELKNMGVKIDTVYTSYLKRAQDTLKYILEESNLEDIEVKKRWELNERHYGFLQGLNKSDMMELCGKELVHTWRRSYSTRPPALTKDDIRYSGHDSKYDGIENLPLTESLEDTVKRTIEVYNREIQKDLNQGKNVLVVAHGNSLRSIIKYLDNISDKDIEAVEVELAKLYVYDKI